MVSRSVRAPGITSSKGIRATGEKKCMPITRSGRRAASAIRVIGIVDVFDATTAVGPVAASTSRTTFCLTWRSSKTASITSSARPNPEYTSLPESNATSGVCSYLVMRRRLSRSSRMARAAPNPAATRPSSVSRRRTSTPAWATAVPAIPEPMNPDPTMPSRCTASGGGASGAPRSFFSSVVAKKICTSLRDTSVTASWPNSWASRLNPCFMPRSSPVRTASSAAGGAG